MSDSRSSEPPNAQDHQAPPGPSRRFILIGGLVVAAIIGFFVLLPCTLNEIGARAALGRDIAMWHGVHSAIDHYHMELGHYPSSLDEPDFRPYLSESAAAFLREGRVTYHPPSPDSPPTFIIIHMTTPRGDYRIQLDRTLLYPKPR